jgi:type II secretion system protein J
MNRRARQYGFTLVELIAALSVTVLVVGATAVILRTVAAARQRVERQMAAQQEARHALNVIVTALTNVQRPPGDNKPLLEGIDDWRGDAAADRIRFFTLSHRVVRRGEPESDLRQIEFALGEPDDPDALGSVLQRRTDPTLNAEPDVGGVVERIAENVIELDIRYHDGLEWHEEWPLRAGAWPLAIRVRLTVIADPQRKTVWSVSRLVGFPHWRRKQQEEGES